MTIDVTLFAQWCVALTAIIVFLKWVSAPVKHVLDNNKKAMEALESAIVKISDDLKDNNFKWTESKTIVTDYKKSKINTKSESES